MNASPTVSVLTTIFNRETFITECIESVQKSRFQDYEHILVDDQSTDNSVAIAQSIAENDPRMRLHVNAQNLGDYPNRNQAADLSRGKYIKYLDADDQHGKWILDIMVDAMETFPEAGLGLIDYSTDNLPAPIQLSPSATYNAFYSNQFSIFHRSPLGAIIKREAFIDAGGFSGRRMVGDFELWHKIARQFPVVVIPHNLACYRRAENGSETALWRSDPTWPLLYKKVAIEQLEHIACPLEETLRNQELLKIKRQAARSTILALKSHGISKANEMRGMLNWNWTTTLQLAFKK